MAVEKIRLILGDQLNINHSWFENTDDSVLHLMMEINSESDYVKHHIQKIAGIFQAMRLFSDKLKSQGHQVKYYHINDKDNKQSFEQNIDQEIAHHKAICFEYLEPDEYRLDQLLLAYCDKQHIETKAIDTEHFFTKRKEMKTMFEGKKQYLMETFYRAMRKKHTVLREDDKKPITGKWNYDHENRKKLPKNHVPTAPLFYDNDVTEILEDIENAALPYFGNVDGKHFLWPVTREQALKLYDYFLEYMLQYFGAFQDSMSQHYWSVYHSRISFAMNIKLISPVEIVKMAETHWRKNQDTISIAQVEGFIRQIIGWREYMRGVYWAEMPEFASKNYFENKRKLPSWYWTGETNMNCLSKSIKQSLDHAYAHHIQRLMVTGNFALLAEINPDEVDEWYLGIYIDAFEWVEITNTRGMSQFADGGIVGTKPYVSSGSYVHKMGDYCAHCKYDVKKKTGEGACPFNSLYWNFIDQHRALLAKNPRMSMMYRVWDKYDAETKVELLLQAQKYLRGIEKL